MSTVRLDQANDHLEDRRFPRAVASEEADDFARPDPDINVIDDDTPAVAFDEIFGFQA
jgi:hypothetical protein